VPRFATSSPSFKSPNTSIELSTLTPVAKDAIEKVIKVGQKFYDPKNNSIVSVVKGGMASGKNIAVARDAIMGAVKTVFTSSKSVISSRFIPMN
jgi:hypothetical protein